MLTKRQLEKGKVEVTFSYQYRYLADGQTWHNDWAADAYVPNPYGSDNAVVTA